jgi:GNAT superfamily N-acetyltransferase
LARLIRPAHYSRDIEPLRDEAYKWDVFLWEKKLPIMWWIAEDFAGQPLGTIGILKRYRRVRGWYVRPEFRNYGVGTQLLDTVIEAGRDLGFHYLEIKTVAKEVAESCGFRASGRTYTSFKLGTGYQLFYAYTFRNYGETK